MASGTTYRFHDIVVDVAAMQVLRGEGPEARPVALEPQSFRLLQFLIENRNRVVSKEAIFEVVWEGRAVSDNALTRAIAQLRKALGDDSRTPLYIDTVPTVGYRFIGELQPGPAAAPSSAAQPLIHSEAPPLPPPAPRDLRRFLAPAAVVVLILGFAAATLRHSRNAVKQAPPESANHKPIQLTNFGGWTDWPKFSPDGNEIAFGWAKDAPVGRGGDLYVKQIGSDKPPLHVTSSNESDSWPMWSPDGTTLAFMRYVAPYKADLMLVPAHGGPERKLIELDLWIDRGGNSPVWSRNGKWIVVPGYTNLGVVLYRVSVDTGQATPIIPPQNGIGYSKPEISPDGKMLIFVAHPAAYGGRTWSVHVDPDMNALDTPRQVDFGKRTISHAIFNADGTQIIGRDMNGEVVRVNVDGSGEQQIIPELPLSTLDGAVSPRGDRLAYVLRRGNANIWRVKLTGGASHSGPAQPPEPLIASPMREAYPQISPDGRRLTFHGYHGTSDVNVWMSDADGSNQRKITDFHGGVTGTAHWSPDSKMLSFDSSTSGMYEIYTVNADGTGVQQITHGTTENFGSTWSRDGKWIYFSSRATGQHEVWKILAQGGQPVQVTHNTGWMPTESLDGKTLFYCKDSPSGTLWSDDLQSGHEEQVSNTIYRCNYAVGKQGIYYEPSPPPDERAQIMFYSFATKHSTVVLQIGVPEYGMDVSPDGQYLVYTQLDNAGGDLMLLEGFK